MSKPENLKEIPVDQIDEPQFLMHPQRNLERLEEIAQSIRQGGIINPVVVRQKGSRYQIVAGHQRYLACKLFGIPKVLCRITEMDDSQAVMASAVENIQRLEHDLLEEAKMYKALIIEHNVSIAELASRLGKTEAYIKARLDLLEMPEPIQQLVRQRKLQAGVIPTLKKIEKPEDKILVGADISRRDYTVEDAKHVINAFITYRAETPEKPPEQTLEKAREEPLRPCDWCREEKKLRTFYQLFICGDCYRRLMYLDEKFKYEKTQTMNAPP